MFNKDRLCSFLVTAKKATYASGDSSQNTINEDKSTTIIFKDGDWKYHDNYYGGEPYGGREVVFYQNQPVYIMVYYGYVIENTKDVQGIYKILQEALRNISSDYPYRGPKLLKNYNFTYLNNYEGEIDNFSGEEIIKDGDIEVYRAKYIGGFVDKIR